MMDSIQTIINDIEEVEFYVSLDYHVGDTELYTCEGWGELYTELGIYDNQPTILDGDSDLDEDGIPDHHLWNSFAGETYSAYAFIDHHMVIRYLSYMPDFELFTQTLIPDLVGAMYGCTDPEASNYEPSVVYDDGSCEFYDIGDINQDYTVNITDIIFVIQIILENIEPTEGQIELADVNYDNGIDISDIIIIVEMILENSNTIND